MQTGSSETLIGWKSGKTTMGPNGGSMAMDSVGASQIDSTKSIRPANPFLLSPRFYNKSLLCALLEILNSLTAERSGCGKLQKYIAKQKCTVRTVSCEVLSVGKRRLLRKACLKNQNSVNAEREKGKNKEECNGKKY